MKMSVSHRLTRRTTSSHSCLLSASSCGQKAHSREMSLRLLPWMAMMALMASSYRPKEKFKRNVNSSDITRPHMSDICEKSVVSMLRSTRYAASAPTAANTSACGMQSGNTEPRRAKMVRKKKWGL